MSSWIWVGVLIVAVWFSHWGAERIARPLKKLRTRWGLTQVAGAAIVGLATASPEIGINVASAFAGVPDIGLGAMLGSNILAIPLVVSVAYWASRKKELQSHEDHARHRQEHLLSLPTEAVTVQAFPYLAIVVLVAVLTLPPAWRGLQPVDGWIMLVAYAIYLTQALLRGRSSGQDENWSKKELLLALAGLAALVLGAFFTVKSTQQIVSSLGISKVVGGLFITAPMSALPEIFAVWSVTRCGQVTSAVTSVLGDHAVTLTIAFLPLALITVPIENLPLFVLNIGFVAAMPAAFAACIHWGSSSHGFKLWQVLLLDAIYLIYIFAVIFGVLRN